MTRAESGFPIAARAARILIGLTLAAGMLASSAPTVAPASAGTEALPDLAVAPLADFRIDFSSGSRLLRFTAMMVNVGGGAFELRGSRSSVSEPMSMRQVIYQTSSRTSPVSREVGTSAVAMYSGDGHNHWHVMEMMRYDMWGPTGTFRGAKVGFCFLDSDAYNLGLPGAVGSPHYFGSGCGTNPNALSNVMGLSIGWGDKYGWSLPFQWIDITGLPSGTYTVRAMVDPYRFFIESTDVNRCAYATVSISEGSNAVQVTSSGDTCVNDWSDSLFAADIAWAFDTGITQGCALDLFCTNSAVTREQMASFLARALNLLPAGTDYFSDDGDSIHQDDINSIAAAGITFGCGGGRFCPRTPITREQMASFLVRGFGLGQTATDFFTDDEASAHEADINSAAAAEVTTGCGGGQFCPLSLVTRGQMAAFLHRAMD